MSTTFKNLSSSLSGLNPKPVQWWVGLHDVLSRQQIIIATTICVLDIFLLVHLYNYILEVV